jgi:hypothetical protein
MVRGRREDELRTPVTKGRLTCIGPDNRLHVPIPVCCGVAVLLQCSCRVSSDRGCA